MLPSHLGSPGERGESLTDWTKSAPNLGHLLWQDSPPVGVVEPLGSLGRRRGSLAHREEECFLGPLVSGASTWSPLLVPLGLPSMAGRPPSQSGEAISLPGQLSATGWGLKILALGC